MKCKRKFHARKCNSNQKWNNNKCWCECKKKILYVKKALFRIVVHLIVKMENI